MILILLTFFGFMLYYNRASPKLPPGPSGFPLIGCLHLLRSSMCVTLKEFGETFGPIYTIKLGCVDFVVLHSFEALTEALKKQSIVFSGKSKDTYSKLFLKREFGIIGSDGELWKFHRQSAMFILKNCGFGKDGSKKNY